MDTPPQSSSQSPITFQLVKASQAFASRCACVMFGLSVSAALELLQLFLLFPLPLLRSLSCVAFLSTPPPPLNVPCFMHLFIPPPIARAALKTRDQTYESLLCWELSLPSDAIQVSHKKLRRPVSTLQMRLRQPFFLWRPACCHDRKTMILKM